MSRLFAYSEEGHQILEPFPVYCNVINVLKLAQPCLNMIGQQHEFLPFVYSVRKNSQTIAARVSSKEPQAMVQSEALESAFRKMNGLEATNDVALHHSFTSQVAIPTVEAEHKAYWSLLMVSCERTKN